MNRKSDNIFPVFEKIMGREAKEALLKQRAKVIWMTGLSGSGKSTIAQLLERRLHGEGFLTQVIDGDNVRTGINSNLGFSEEDRKENIRRVAEVSKLFLHCGVITINCFISPTRELRAMARKIIGADDFIEVYVNAPLTVCEERDVKGLYEKARKGEITDFTGIHQPFEAPDKPDVELKTDHKSAEKSTDELYAYVKPLINK